MLADQFLEKRPVMNHCLAQFFRAGLPPRLPKRDFVSRSVVFQDQWMANRDICRSLFKVTNRIAPGGQHITQQLVRIRYSTGGAVNKARLDLSPRLHEARTIALGERTDMEPLDSLCTLFQLGFRLLPAAAFLYGASIFSLTELRAQPSSPALSVRKESDDASRDYHDESND